MDYDSQQEGKVFFGAWVEIENDAGKVMELRLVGYDEKFGRKDYISIDSPMARALLGKDEDDEFVVKTETGTKEVDKPYLVRRNRQTVSTNMPYLITHL